MSDWHKTPLGVFERRPLVESLFTNIKFVTFVDEDSREVDGAINAVPGTAHKRIAPLTKRKGDWVQVSQEAFDEIERYVGRKVKADKEERVFDSVPVLTLTSKMNCWSFSLPAGPGFKGGTCPASGLRSDPSKKFVCHNCYALKGSYEHIYNIAVSSVRYRWTKQCVKDGTFVQEMLDAIEIGKEHRRNSGPGFFRIHDCGDFFSEEYFECWVHIAEVLSNVKFWAPTRLWALSEWKKIFASAAIPKNLTIRPSVLYVNEHAPNVDGLPSGSTVHSVPRVDKKTGKHLGPVVTPGGAWACKAYDGDEKTCLGAQNPNGNIGCRACWTMRDLEISYGEH